MHCIKHSISQDVELIHSTDMQQAEAIESSLPASVLEVRLPLLLFNFTHNHYFLFKHSFLPWMAKTFLEPRVVIMALLIQPGPYIGGEESQYSVGNVLLSLGFQLHVGLFHDMGIVILLPVGGSVAEQLEYWTCNSEAQSSSPALTANWICFLQSQVQLLGHACDQPTSLPLAFRRYQSD